MVKEGIVLGHVITEKGIEVDRAKVEVIEKLPWVFGELKEKLVFTPIIISPDWSEPFEVMCDASEVPLSVVLGQRRDKILHTIYYACKSLNEAQKNYTTRAFCGDVSIQKILFLFSWCEGHSASNYFALRKGSENQVANYLSSLEDEGMRELGEKAEIDDVFPNEHVLAAFQDLVSWFVDLQNYLTNDRQELPLKPILLIELFDVWGINLMGLCVSSHGMKHILVAVDYVSKWVEAIVLPNNDGKSAIFNDGGSHFYNKLLKWILDKYGVLHNMNTPYHPQTSRQNEVSNREIKQIMAETVNPNKTYWSRCLDYSLWSYRIAYKIPIGMSPYQLVYAKVCHLPIELEHKAMWVMKKLKSDWTEEEEQRQWVE
nr:uncharacterized protein LOC101247782 [Solanum lycopersicum]